MAVRKILFVVLFLICCSQFAFGQKINFELESGAIFSKIGVTTINYPNLIESSIKCGYLLKVKGTTIITKNVKLSMGLGYIRLGGTQLSDGGYVKDNIEYMGNYPEWSVIRYKDYVKLNYWVMVIEGSYSWNKKIETGVIFNLLFFNSGSIKRKVYITEHNADYAEVVWYRNKTQEKIQEIVFAPEIFAGYKIGKKIGLRISYIRSVNSIYHNSDKYHKSGLVSFNYIL